MKGFTYDPGFDFALKRLKEATDHSDFDVFFNWDHVIKAHEEQFDKSAAISALLLQESA